jgi:hypothetical protein
MELPLDESGLYKRDQIAHKVVRGSVRQASAQRTLRRSLQITRGRTTMLTEPALTRIDCWPIDRLVEYARNPRKNDAVVDRMCASIRQFDSSVRSDGEVVDGHASRLVCKIGFVHHQQIIWNRGRTVLTHTHYWFQHEPCWYVRRKNAPWFGKAGQNSTVRDSPSPKFITNRSSITRRRNRSN